MSDKHGTELIGKKRLTDLGFKIVERMAALGITTFDVDKIRRTIGRDAELLEAFMAIVNESKTDFGTCGRVVSSALRRVQDATERASQRLVAIPSEGSGKGAPCKFQIVETKPETEPIQSDLPNITEVEQIVYAINEAADRIIAAINARP